MRLVGLTLARIFEPLGMRDTRFWAPKEKLDRLAEPFANDPVSGDLVRLIDVTKQPKLLFGNYGLVSTAEDYTKFMLMLIKGGSVVRRWRPNANARRVAATARCLRDWHHCRYPSDQASNRNDPNSQLCTD